MKIPICPYCQGQVHKRARHWACSVCGMNTANPTMVYGDRADWFVGRILTPFFVLFWVMIGLGILLRALGL